MSHITPYEHNSACRASAIVCNEVASVARMTTNATHALRDNVRNLMDQRGWSQHMLAAKSRVAQTTIGNILRYRDAQDKHPSTDTLERLANAFGLPAWRLLLPQGASTQDVSEPEPLDAELLTAVLIEAADVFRGLNVMPSFNQVAGAAVHMYTEVQTGIPMRRAAASVAHDLDQIVRGTNLASLKGPSGEGSKHGQGNQGAPRGSKARTR